MKGWPGAPPARLLVPLVALVATVHLLLLRWPPEAEPQHPPQAPAFATREIVPPPPAAPRSVARPATPPRAVAPAPAPTAAATPAPTAAPGPVAPALALAVPAPATAARLEAPPVATPAPPSAKEARTAAASHLVVIPAPGRMRFDLLATYHGLPVSGRAELLWRHDGRDYEARLEVSALLLPKRVQTSSGRITPEGLQPVRFAEKTRSEEAAHFQRDAGKITFSNNRPDAPLLPGAQDRLSVLLQLAAMVAGEPARYPPGSAVAIPTAGTRESETWTFTVEGEEDLALPIGRQRALKLQRLPRHEYDVKLELWLAPRLDHALVRLRLTNPNGDSVDQRLAATDRP